MSAAKERESKRIGRRSFLRSLASDPVRKLLALALAVPLWIFLDSQVTVPKTERFPLAAKGAAVDADTYPLLVDLGANEQYRVKGFRDSVDEAELKAVELTFKGPKHVVDAILDAPDVFVRPRAGAINAQNVFVFDRSDIRSSDPNVAKSIEEMKPRRVAVVLERVATEPFVLAMSRVQVEYPDPVRFPDFRARLRLDAADFSERHVSLRGARQQIDAAMRDERPLFRLDLRGFGTATTPRVSATLSLLPGFDLSVVGNSINVSIPLDPKFEDYELKVPVLLDTLARPRASGEEFECDATLSVRVRVSGELAGTLSTLPAGSERDDWAKEHARVDVRVSADTVDGQILIGTLRLTDPHYQRGRDYQGVNTLSVQVRLKKKE